VGIANTKNYPAASSGVSKNLDSVIPHLMRNPEIKAKRLSTFLLVPDTHPLDSRLRAGEDELMRARFHGNDIHGSLTPRLTPSQADGVLKNKLS